MPKIVGARGSRNGRVFSLVGHELCALPHNTKPLIHDTHPSASLFKGCRNNDFWSLPGALAACGLEAQTKEVQGCPGGVVSRSAVGCFSIATRCYPIQPLCQICLEVSCCGSFPWSPGFQESRLWLGESPTRVCVTGRLACSVRSAGKSSHLRVDYSGQG